MTAIYSQAWELLSSKDAEYQWRGETVGKEYLFTKLKSKC